MHCAYCAYKEKRHSANNNAIYSAYSIVSKLYITYFHMTHAKTRIIKYKTNIVPFIGVWNEIYDLRRDNYYTHTIRYRVFSFFFLCVLLLLLASVYCCSVKSSIVRVFGCVHHESLLFHSPVYNDNPCVSVSACTYALLTVKYTRNVHMIIWFSGLSWWERRNVYGGGQSLQRFWTLGLPRLLGIFFLLCHWSLLFVLGFTACD